MVREREERRGEGKRAGGRKREREREVEWSGVGTRFLLACARVAELRAVVVEARRGTDGGA